MSGGVVTFDYAVWAAAYPELAVSVTSAQAQNDFDIASLFLDNSACSMVVNLTKRALLLNMLTSHIAALALRSANAADQSGSLVGRMATATEGSVTGAFEMGPPSMSAEWFNQTRYGALAWQALAPYRSGLYVAPPQIPLAAQSWPGGFGSTLFAGGFPWPR